MSNARLEDTIQGFCDTFNRGDLDAARTLLATDPDAAAAEARVLLERWSMLHAVRTTLSLVTFTLLLWQLCVA